MGSLPLEAVFRPASIAVVGATDKPGALGGRVYGNLKQDFKGRLYPVNARSPEVFGDRAYPSVRDLPEPTDLIVVLVPATHVVAVIEDSIAAGHGGVYLISSGFSEVGGEGTQIQERIAALAREHGFPVVGPNCVGYMNQYDNIMATFAIPPGEQRPKPGPVGIVSQSGGFGAFILNRAVNRGVGVGMFASTGNQCDVTLFDVLEYFVEQPELQVIAMFSEGVRDPAPFLRAAKRAIELGKVIISVSPGTSEAVARAVLSHTASIVGSAEVYRAVCEQYGVLEADSIDTLLDYAIALQDGRRMRGNRIGIVTQSGGAGVLFAGDAANHGLEVPELAAGTQERIAAVIPAFGSARNPIDTTPGVGLITGEVYATILRELLSDDSIDAGVVLGWYGGDTRADAIVEVYHSQDKPLVPVVAVNPELMQGRDIPSFTDPTRAVQAVAAIARTSRRVMPDDGFTVDEQRAARSRQALDEARSRPFVLETTAKDVLARYGVPVSRERTCSSADEAVAAFREIGSRVVLKVMSYDLPHKSDSGGLVLNLRSEREVLEAFDLLTERFREEQPSVTVDSILVQEMVSSRLELAVGMQRDPVFGPMVAVGLGGVLIELIGEPVLLRAPFGLAQARAAVDRIAGGRIDHPTRGLPKEYREQLAQVVLGVGQLSVECPEVMSVDVNPVMVTADGIRAVDALIVLDTPG
ncbi:acetate--CoA ligase family protein [Frankia gtarii]|uniref:acetate--CoA ligase family protein n=1 Tax=Frankia gtarii TaxID=2950102 RepID=UPI0021C0AE4F|nr:acetate--CoA ligase family protein [Frankia gtarii]